MFKKRIFLAAVLCLALASLLPASGSALTLADLTGSTTQSSYAPVTITSATNKTITITATPAMYLGSAGWTYQLAWNRVKNVQGSLYISPKSSASTKVMSVTPADRAGSVSVTLQPSTAYRVEFYSSPNAKGSLLVRKYFTTRAAEPGSEPYMLNGSTNSSFFNSNFGTPSVSLSGSASAGTAGGNVFYGSAMGSYASGAAGYANSPSTLQRMGKLVGPAIDLGPTTQCDKARQSQSASNISGSLQNPDNLLSNDQLCAHIAQTFVSSVSYQGSDGKCYHSDTTGTYELSCAQFPGLPKLNVTTKVTQADLPSVTDANFNWENAGARCQYVTGDTAPGAPYAQEARPICGTYRGGPIPTQSFCQLHPSDASCAPLSAYNPSTSAPSGGNPSGGSSGNTGAGNPSAGGSSGAGTVPTWSYTGYATGAEGYLNYQSGLQKMGKLVGPPINLGPTTQCDKSRQAQSITSGSSANPENLLSNDQLCAHVGQTFVSAITYQGSDGKCYHSDTTGTYELNCSLFPGLPKLNTTTTVTQSVLPSIYDSSFNWQNAGARCQYVTGDTAPGAPYAQESRPICGAGPHGTYMPPVNFCEKYPNDPSCIKTAYSPANSSLQPGGIYGVAGAAGYVNNPSGLQKSGRLVGPPIDLGPTTQCDQSRFATSLSLYQANSSNPDNLISANAACAHVGQTFVSSVSYQGSDGKCYHSDTTGTYEITCMQGLPKLNVTTKVTQADLPSIYDSSFNWLNAGAQCTYITGDMAAGAPYGMESKPICGAGPHGTYLPADNFCMKYPNDASCTWLQSSGNPAAPAASGQVPAAFTTGSSVSCHTNADCSASGMTLCFGVTPTNYYGTCGY